MRPSDLPLIRRARLFAHVTEPELAALLDTCFVQTLPRGTTPCQQGEKAEFLHVVLSGKVGLFAEGPREETLIEFFGPGDGFVLPAVMLDMPYLVTARLTDESRILLWPATAFRAEMRANGALAYGATLQLSSYWRILVGQIKDLKLLSATERLSAMLIALAPRPSGSVTVTLPGSHRLIAGRLGITPQSLSRAFATLRSLGVTCQGRQIAIADLGRLRDLTGIRS